MKLRTILLTYKKCVIYWEGNKGCNRLNPYLLMVLLSMPFNKLPRVKPKIFSYFQGHIAFGSFITRVIFPQKKFFFPVLKCKKKYTQKQKKNSYIDAKSFGMVLGQMAVLEKTFWADYEKKQPGLFCFSITMTLFFCNTYFGPFFRVTNRPMFSKQK